jgi:hypothetical protein
MEVEEVDEIYQHGGVYQRLEKERRESLRVACRAI